MVIRAIQGNVVKRTAIQQSVEVLKGLPVKEREELALREAIYEMLPELEGVLARGYSLDEVAGILSQNGVSIKGATLKTYLREGRKQRSRKRSRPARSRGRVAEKSQESSVSGDLGEGVNSDQADGSQGLEGQADKSAGKESEGKGEGDKAGKAAGDSEPGSAIGSGKAKTAKASGRKVGEFTEVPDDL